MRPLSDRDAEALTAYLSGDCSDANHAAVTEWLATDPSNRQVLHDMERLHGSIRVRQPLADVDSVASAVARVVARAASAPVADQNPVAVRAIPQTSRWTWRRNVVSLVAAGGIAAAAVFAWTMRQSTEATGVVRTYMTQNGERTTVQLPDGSTVLLNVASRLEVPADFNGAERTVTLTGEALFTVTQHASAPFTIVSGNVVTRVLGTTFAVRRYDTDRMTTVAVRDGKVAVQGTVVTADEQAHIDSEGTVHVATADPNQFAFASGTLTFDRIPLKNAIVTLNRWYDVDIQLTDPAMGDMPLSGLFTAKSTANLANTLALTFNARVVLDGHTITLSPR